MHKIIFSLLFFIAIFCPATYAQKLNAKIAKQHQINKIVVLPAKVSIVKTGIKGSEPMEKETTAAKPLFEQAVSKVLQGKKFTVLEGEFKPEVLEADEKLKYTLGDLQTNFDDLNQKIVRKTKDIEKGRFTLGDKVLLINPDDQVDAFVFIRAVGQQSTKGKKAFAVLTLNPALMMYAFPRCYLQLTIVDARTGEILAQSQAFTLGDVIKDTDKTLTKPLEKSLKKMPSPSAKSENK